MNYITKSDLIWLQDVFPHMWLGSKKSSSSIDIQLFSVLLCEHLSVTMATDGVFPLLHWLLNVRPNGSFNPTHLKPLFATDFSLLDAEISCMGVLGPPPEWAGPVAACSLPNTEDGHL